MVAERTAVVPVVDTLCLYKTSCQYLKASPRLLLRVVGSRSFCFSHDKRQCTAKNKPLTHI